MDNKSNVKKEKTSGRKTYEHLGIEKVKSYCISIKPSEHEKILAKYGTLTAGVRETLVKEINNS